MTELVDDEFVADSEEELEAEAGDDASTVARIDMHVGGSSERVVEPAPPIEVTHAAMDDNIVAQEIGEQRVDIEHSELPEQRDQDDDAAAKGDAPSVEEQSPVRRMSDKLDRVEAPARDDSSTQDTVTSASASIDSIHVEGKSGDGAEEDDSKDVWDTQPTVGPRPLFKVGDIVHVAARTWPGINKLGGAGKIAGVIEEEGQGDPEKVVFLYNVKYMLGGFEKRIEEEYIQDLSTALETGARPVKERVFYHDEFSVDRLKKKRVPLIIESDGTLADETLTSAHRRGQSNEKQSSPKKFVLIDAPEDDDEEMAAFPEEEESEFESAGDGNDGGSEVEGSDNSNVPHSRKLNDGSFVLKRKRPKRDSKSNKQHESRSKKSAMYGNSNIHRKRRRRIVDSDDEEDGNKVRNLIKRRYVGGYVHGTRDDDGTFIQPEGNPAELPEDIASKLNMKVGKSKSELREQLNTVADRLLENLGKFSSEKTDLHDDIKNLRKLDKTQLKTLHQRLCGLGDFVRHNLIRSGEDVMNWIIKLLEKKGGRLPERIDLQFESWKQQITENDVWVKTSLRSLDPVLARHGVSISLSDYLDTHQNAINSEVDMSDSDAAAEDDHLSDNNSVSSSSRPVQERVVNSHSSKRLGRKVSRVARKRPRSSVTQSSLDDHAIPLLPGAHSTNDFPSIASSNFRLLAGVNRPTSKDPQWDWTLHLRKIHRLNTQATAPDAKSYLRNYAKGSRTRKSGKTLSTANTVHDALEKLREQRFRRVSASFRPSRTSFVVDSYDTSYLAPDISKNAQSRLSRPGSIVQAFEAAINLKHSKANQPKETHQSSRNDVVVPRESVDWDALFCVLHQLPSPPKYASALSNDLVVMKSILLDEDWSAADIEHDTFGDPISSICAYGSHIRQQLNLIRAFEWNLVDDMFRTRRGKIELDEDINQDEGWNQLQSLALEFKHELGAFVTNALAYVTYTHPHLLHFVISSVLGEITRIVQQIPDCFSVFGASPQYPYFFEVISPRSGSTPLIDGICQTLGHMIQLLLNLKARYGDGSAEVASLFKEVLPPNRLFLTSCLFLMDLHIYLPSSLRLAPPVTANATSSAICEATPAFLLWDLLHESFSILNPRGGSDTINLWGFLRTLYEQGFVEHLASCFVSTLSCGGYLKLHPATIDSGNRSAALQAKLLAAELVWDLCIALHYLAMTARDSRNGSTHWALARALCSDGRAFLPFGALTKSDMTNEAFRRHSNRYLIRILKRIFLLAALWEPCNDIVGCVLSNMWDETTENFDGSDELIEVLEFIGELSRTNVTCKESVVGLVEEDIAARDNNPTSLVCKILLVQLTKLEKVILRTRYRQPVLRTLTARAQIHEADVTESSSPAKDPSTGSKVAWNWGPSEKNASHSKAVKPSSPLAPHVVLAERKLMMLVLVTLGLSGVCLDEAAHDTKPINRGKAIKRDIEFFCTELLRLASDLPVLGTHLSDCLQALGVAAVHTGAGYATVFSHIDELAWKSNDMRKEFVNKMSNGGPIPLDATQLQRLAELTSACLQATLELSTQLISRLNSAIEVGSSEADDAKASVASILGNGLSSSIDMAGDGSLPISDLDNALAIAQLWLPRKEGNPARCLKFRCSPSVTSDEFDDPDLMDVWAMVDLDSLQSSTSSVRFVSALCEVQRHAEDHAIRSLRLPLQRLVMNFPEARWRSPIEIFAIDLFGSMVASCSFQFSWSVVGSKNVKPRMLAPRLMNAILKYSVEKDWLSVCFLSEQNADQELISMWIVATLDIKELLDSKKPGSNGCEDKDQPHHAYWLSLTDGILCAIMSNNSVTRYKMSPLLYQLLQETCARSTFADEIAKYSRRMDLAVYYQLRVDTFRCICAGVSAIWSEFTSSPGTRRHEFTQFRLKMMDTQRGVFAAVTEAYEINLRLVCLELDRDRQDWYRLSSRFLADFGSLCSGTSSWHASDDSDQFSRHMDCAIEPLALLFKLMYDCVDALLYYCGEMAIGQQNVFFTIMELMFRQARCAEFPTAEKRIAWGIPTATGPQHSFWLNGSERSLRSSGEKAHNSIPGVSPACVGFVESVRLFFAYQKYPSLIQWFAQTLDTYQTLRAGWPTSPLRVLLYNVVDPHGPLGLHSYYPMDEKAKLVTIDVGEVRREAFYVACGLFHCKCTVSYEHTRQGLREQLTNNLPSLRRFVVQDFVHELIESTIAQAEDTLESIIPVCQLIKAIAHHASIDSHRNLNSTGMSLTTLVEELRPTISHLFVIVTHVLEEDSDLRLSVSYVLLIEVIRIIEELFSANEATPCQDLTKLVHWGVRCAAVVYGILRRLSSAEVEVLFEKEAEDALPSKLRREITTMIPCVCTKSEKPCCFSAASLSRTSDDYGISKARARADLFGGIRRLNAKCRQTKGFEGIILINVFSTEHELYGSTGGMM